MVGFSTGPETRPHGPQSAGVSALAVAQAASSKAGLIQSLTPSRAAADLVLCRAGAITVSELCVAGLPSILVPFVVKTTAHQRANAQFLARHGAAIHLPQGELTPERVAGVLRDLDRTQLLDMAQKAQALGRPTATRTVADAIEHIAKAGAA